MAKQPSRWLKLRARLMDVVGPSCWDCGATGIRLDAHHRYYEAGKAKWDYPDETFELLCPTCHGKADHHRRELSRAIGFLSSAESLRALGYMHGLRIRDDKHAAGDFEVAGCEYAAGIGDAFLVSEDAVIEVAIANSRRVNYRIMAAVSMLPEHVRNRRLA